MNTSLRPRVTVIIPTRDNANALGYVIESVIGQTFVNFEVWVIGDQCTDHTEDVVNSFCDPRIFWFNVPSRMQNEFRLINEGVRRARGEYIAYLQDGDLWLPNHLEVLVGSMEESDTEIVVSITQCVYSNNYSSLNIPLLPDLPTIPNLSSLLHKKYCVPMPAHEIESDYATEFFRRAFENNIRMEVTPITTGLKFLWQNGGHAVVPQKHYMERLRKDSDFINKELSAILFRSEHAMQTSDGRDHWMSGWIKPFQRVFENFLARTGIRKLHAKQESLHGFRGKQPEVQLVPKSAKAL